MGWSLSFGVTGITRKTSKGILKYKDSVGAESDTFILSGYEDLVVADEPPVDIRTLQGHDYIVKRYRCRIESEPQVIERWTNLDDDGDTLWRTISPSNQVHFLGRTDQSRIFDASNPKRIFTWMLCEVHDPLGNAMVYIYKEEDEAGISELPDIRQACEAGRDGEARTRARYLKAIKCGNRKPSREAESWEIEHRETSKVGNVENEWMFEVVLDYGEHHVFEPSTNFVRDWNTGQYDTQSLPAISFDYSQVPEFKKLQTNSIKPKLICQLAASQANPSGVNAQWIDLDGEGISGLIVQLDGTWYYGRNECPLQDPATDDMGLTDDESSSASVTLFTREVTKQVFADIDGNGSQNLVVLDVSGRPVGYYERTEDQDWTTFREFETILSNETAKVSDTGPVRKFDVTGNGLVDFVTVDQSHGQVLWHESLGKKGYAAQRRSRGPGQPVFWDDSDQRTATTLADMSGDGLVDILQLSNGHVSYWPSLGYGRFGSQVIMNNSPLFDQDEDKFDSRRILLADVDGSGAADLLYILSDGGLMLHRNCCGNGFSDGILLPCFPRVSDVSSLFVMDLFGKGTSCICMMEQDTAQEVVIRYYDFNSSPISPTSKPNMLTAFENGVGLHTTITYWPSTKFYLKDQRAGKPWRTKVPFPVQVVQKVVYQDLITGRSKTCRYHYHDGHYDGHDREFRGFGMVEESVRETLLLTNGNRYQKPPSLKKVWYHTGIMASLTPDSATTFQNPQISSRLPPGLSSDGLYQSSRALRGLELRSELYSPDGTAKAKLPYVVIERSYLVTQEQEPKPSGCHGVFRTHASEILTLNYERNAENPRIQHEIVIQRNSHGDVERYLDIRYGSKGSLLNGPNRTAQEINEVRYTDIEYTNAVSSLDVFRKPLVSQSSSFYILGLPIDHQILDGRKLASEDLDQYLVKPANILNDSDYSCQAEKSKILCSSTRTIYRSQDMTGPLQFKELEPFSIVDQVFELALDRERHLQIYGSSNKILSRFGRDYTTILEREGLFIDLDGDGNLWAPSSVTYFGTPAAKNLQLPEARRSFFSPTVTKDPFKAQSTVEMDGIYLLPCNWTDANGNVTRADNDYRVLRAGTIKDPNDNQLSVIFDSLGRTVAWALRGKQVAESLNGLTANLAPHETAALFNHPTPDLVKKLLGRAGSRIIFGPEPVLGDSKLSPMFQISMGRTGLDSAECLEDGGDIFFKISYFNGYSQGIQDVSLASWGDHDEKWRYSGSVVLDSNAVAVQVAPPFFSSDHYFIPHATLTSPSVTSFYDGANRVSGELYRDHSWVKTCYDDAWSMRQFSREDTVLTEDPRNDPDIGIHFQALSTSTFLPSWRDKRLASIDELMIDSAIKSEAFAHTPVTTHFDSSGRPSVISTTDGSVIRNTSFKYDVYGNRNAKIDGAGRVVQRTEFNNLGRALRVSSLDSGDQVNFCDCLGEIIATKDSRGILKRYVRDKLRRVTQTWVAEDKLAEEVLWSEVVYGDNREYFPDGSQQSNRNHRVARIYDQSGVRTFDEYDIRGNCTMSTMQLAAEYRSLFNATADMVLESEIWSTQSVFDASNRDRQSKDPTGTVTVRSYNFLS
ncbi:uncharacterized protein FSUBG_13855 [Fusarium subglutinans]|uniref:SpvB-domain-containing protein n=1 Tax=Gibberella subglutinans TaxID=42677 RepID=A0A8H5KS16_GIBSU|nr:uncharacterized protein FSUBG_13855 [Fusarium subglutinans]KAF5578164.1 hypothetical protein FSUBG_13855 [Fusarium subglutinans]